MARALLRFGVLALLWAAWSGHTEPLIVGFGIASCAIVVAIMSRGRRFAEVWDTWSLGLRPLLFLPWLGLQVVKSNLKVAAIILSPRLPISPRLVLVPADQATPSATALHANSITLTPGTISLDVRDDAILVHALTEEGAHAAVAGAMGRKISALEPKS